MRPELSGPNWYLDPAGSQCQRWWDGEGWSRTFAPMPTVASPSSPIGFVARGQAVRKHRPLRRSANALLVNFSDSKLVHALVAGLRRDEPRCMGWRNRDAGRKCADIPNQVCRRDMRPFAVPYREDHGQHWAQNVEKLVHGHRLALEVFIVRRGDHFGTAEHESRGVAALDRPIVGVLTDPIRVVDPEGRQRRLVRANRRKRCDRI